MVSGYISINDEWYIQMDCITGVERLKDGGCFVHLKGLRRKRIRLKGENGYTAMVEGIRGVLTGTR